MDHHIPNQLCATAGTEQSPHSNSPSVACIPADDALNAADDDGLPRSYVPTESEIAAACAEIRDGWTDEERASRYVGQRYDHWRLPGSDRGHAVTERGAIRQL